MPNRINVLNDPVNFVDPDGLIDVHIGTDEKIAEKVADAKKEVEKADWLNSELQDKALDTLDWLEDKAEKVDACIHHEVAPDVPGKLTIEPITDGPKVEGGKITYELPF
ncbi:MAG: hypothetical protein SWH61_07665 [Thermodesulfobacteriota bacterium]|nr:hypothetical protein [Thermodesulfobacteriota bacterium]